MLDDYKSLPFIVGVSILFLVPCGMVGIIYSSLQSDNTENATGTADSPSESNPLDGLATKQNIRVAPAPIPETSSSHLGVDSNTSQGIPIGKYSNPPTTIQSPGVALPETSHPLNNSSSIVESNRREQQNTSRLIHDYSTPAASNNFHRTEDNSLIDPLEEDSFLEAPDSDNPETIPLSPVNEPLLSR